MSTRFMPVVSQSIDWPGIRAAAVIVGVREAARQAGADLPSLERNRFVERVLKRSAREGWIVQKAEIMSATRTNDEKAMSANVLTGAESMQNMLDAEKNPKLLSLLEKREFLASAVRTPIGEIDGKSPLAHKIRRRTDKDGSTSEEIESVAKLRALELDAKLAGELDSEKGTDPGLVAITLVRIELPPATQAAAGPLAIDI